MAEKVTLRIGADTSEIEKAFSSLIKKIQGDADKLKISPAAGKLAPGVESAQSAAQTNRALDQRVRQEKAGLDLINRELAKKEQTVARLQKLQDASNKGLEREIQLKNQLARAERELEEKKNVARIQQVNYERATEAANRARGITPGTAGAGGGGGLDISSILKGGLAAAGIGLTAGAAVTAAKEAYSFFASEAARTNIAAGSAVQSNVGYLNSAILSKDVARQALIQNQMPKARELAQQNFDRDFLNYYLKQATDITSEFGIEAPKRSFETRRANEIGNDAIKQAQSLLAQNNPLQLAEGFFDQTFERNLNAERASGLSTDQFKKLQMKLNDNLFLTDQGTAMLSQIQSAGGAASGPKAEDTAVLGLQMQRAFNLTNAGGVLGKLTGLYGGTTQGAAKTEDASARILETAITRGFNKSENTEILRKFTETSAALVYQGEARKEGDVGRITDDFSRLLSDNPTIKQFEATQSAFERYQNLTSQTSGRGGALGFAAMQQGGNFSKLSAIQFGNLMELPEARITATNSDVVAAAVQQGISPEEMVTNLLKAKQTQSLATVGLSEKQLSPLKKYLGNRSVTSLAGNVDELNALKKTNPEAFKAYEELQQRTGLAGTFASDEEKRQTMNILYQGPAGYKNLSETQRAKRALETGTAGKREEEYIAIQAAQEKQLVQNLKALEGELYPTIKGISALTQIIMALGNAAHILTTGELGSALTRNPINQPVETRGSLSRTPGNGSKPHGGSR